MRFEPAQTGGDDFFSSEAPVRAEFLQPSGDAILSTLSRLPQKELIRTRHADDACDCEHWSSVPGSRSHVTQRKVEAPGGGTLDDLCIVLFQRTLEIMDRLLELADCMERTLGEAQGQLPGGPRPTYTPLQASSGCLQQNPGFFYLRQIY